MPEVKDTHIDAALTNVSIEYGSNAYIADKVLPTLPVSKQSDKYFVIDETREGLRQQDDNRAPGAKANEIDFDVSDDSFFCSDHVLDGVIPDEEVANADEVLRPSIQRTEFLTNAILLNAEIAAAATLSAGITNTAAATAVWTDVANADPIADFDAGAQSVMDNAQVAPNAVWFDYKGLRALMRVPSIIDRIKFSSSPTTPSVVTLDALAALFGVENVYVGRAFKNTAAPGATATVSTVWGSDAYIGYIPPRPAPRIMAMGLTFSWSRGGGDAVQGVSVRRWRDEGREGDIIRVRRYYDQKIIVAAAGYKITSIL